MNGHGSNVSTNAACVSVQDRMPHDLSARPAVQATFLLLYCTIFLAGFTGNVLIVCAVVARRPLQTVRNIFVSSLAVCDMLTILTCMPVTVYSLLFKQWVFGELLCHLIPMLQCLTVLSAAFSFLMVAVDRYVVIVRPFDRAPLTRSEALIALAAVWALAITLSAPIGVYQRTVDGDFYRANEEETLLCGTFCDEAWPSTEARLVYGFVLLFLQYVCPVALIAACYIRVAVKVTESASVRLQTSALETKRLQATRQIKRTNRILVSIVAIFALLWLPQTLLNVARDTNTLPSFIDSQIYVATLAFHCMAMSASMWNPLLYLGMNDQFRKVAMRLCCSSAGSSADSGAQNTHAAASTVLLLHDRTRVNNGVAGADKTPTTADMRCRLHTNESLLTKHMSTSL